MHNHVYNYTHRMITIFCLSVINVVATTDDRLLATENGWEVKKHSDTPFILDGLN